MTQPEQFEMDALRARIADLEAELVKRQPAGQFFPSPDEEMMRSVVFAISVLGKKIDALSVKISALTVSVMGETQRLSAAVQAASPKLKPRKEENMATGVQPIDALVNDVASLDTVIDSATALINGFQQRLADGIAAALAAGRRRLSWQR